MKKILFVTHTLGGGGAEKVLINLLEFLAKDDSFDVTLLSIVDTGIYKKQIPSKVSYKSFISIPFRNVISGKDKDCSGSLLVKNNMFFSLLIKIYAMFWRSIPAKLLHKIIIKDKYDYEVAFLEGICAKLVSGGDDDTIKYSWIHVDLLQQHKSKNIFKNMRDEKDVYDRFNKIVCVSNYVRESFLKMFGVDKNKVFVRYNPLKVKDIICKANDDADGLREKNSAHTFVIGSIGRLNKQKQYIRLIKAVKRLRTKKLDVVCYIFGEGTDRMYLEEYIKNNSLDNCVFLPGFVPNPYKYIKDCDLFVCSSIAEGFSTAVSEAVLLGIPVVTTECSGMKEILGESEYGLITENDEEALYVGIEKMILDQNMYNYYFDAVKKRKEFFDFEERCSKIKEMFI